MSNLSTTNLNFDNIVTLSPQKEHELAVDYFENKNIEAAHALTISYLPFVAKVAWRYSFYFRVAVEDLIQEGMIGLMLAVKSFNPYQGSRLLSYAYKRILKRIKEYIIYNWSMVKIGTTTNDRNLFFQAVNLAKEESTDERNIAADLVYRVKQRDYSLNVCLNSETEDTYLDLVEDFRPSLENIIINRDIKKRLTQLIKELTPREQCVIQKKYMSDESHNLQSIANLMGVSRQRVDQLEKKALRKLKTLLQMEEII